MDGILIIRHGQTELNAREMFRGHLDVDLDEIGHRQVAALADYLVERDISVVLSSPLVRATSTAAPVAARHGLGVTIVPELADFDFGEWQGRALSEVAEACPDLFRQWQAVPHEVRIPGAETLADVWRRSGRVITEASRRGGTVLICSHRVVNKLLILRLLGLGMRHFWRIRQDTCGVTSFTCEHGGYVLERHNDRSFLDKALLARLADF